VPPHSLIAISGAFAAIFALSGCAPNAPTRGRLFGKVTSDGVPVHGGHIRFFGLSEGGIGADAELVDGKYDIPASRGPTKGTYRVEIVSLKKTGRRVPDPDSGGDVEEVVNLLPPHYNAQSTLQINYDPTSNQAHDFELKTR
jgi:hypothetical protein